jgi:hypothetical protein
MILLDGIWKIRIGKLWAYRVHTCGKIWLSDSSFMTGNIGGLIGMQTHYYIQQFSKGRIIQAP